MIEDNNTVVGKGGISAKIVAHSKSSVDGSEMITYEVICPRIILSELNKHRMLSNNCQSSRAVPVKKVIEMLENGEGYAPIHWGKNQAGMQADSECDELLGGDSEFPGYTKEEYWQEAKEMAILFAKEYSDKGYHKQIVNRLLEPFQMIKMVISGTEWDNFFYLRRHKDAQPEIAELANCMWEAKKKSVPLMLEPGEWHLPYYKDGYWKKYPGPANVDHPYMDFGHTLEEAKKISAAACAQVSFRKLDLSPETVERVYSRLVDGEQPHSVCLEHQATPMAKVYDSGTAIFDYIENGVTHVDRNYNLWSGNLKGWIQNRKLLPNECCWNYKEQ